MRALMAAPERAIATLDTAARESADSSKTVDESRPSLAKDTSPLGKAIANLVGEL
jgi:hypothetical protein